ncbi:hypothetical protein JCM11957_01090 [Caminibacter profundus]
MDYNSKNPNPTYEDIKKTLEDVEKRVSSYAFCKIAIPLIGTGVGGLDKKEIIKIYKSFFERKINFDCEVIIYGYSKNDYELIKRIFKC